MTESEIQSKLTELMGEIGAMPGLGPQTPAPLASGVQENLDGLRLGIKYLVFDLEATRRENGYLRKILEQAAGQ